MNKIIQGVGMSFAVSIPFPLLSMSMVAPNGVLEVIGYPGFGLYYLKAFAWFFACSSIASSVSVFMAIRNAERT